MASRFKKGDRVVVKTGLLSILDLNGKEVLITDVDDSEGVVWYTVSRMYECFLVREHEVMTREEYQKRVEAARRKARELKR